MHEILLQWMSRSQRRESKHTRTHMWNEMECFIYSFASLSSAPEGMSWVFLALVHIIHGFIDG